MSRGQHHFLLAGVALTPIEGAEEYNSDDLFATHEGFLEIAGRQLKVYQLNDGQRVFDADSVAEFFGAVME